MTTMTARVSWLDGMMFVGESGSGHTVVMDGAAQHGGRDHGIRPMEMLLLGMGGCSAFDVVQILKKGRQPIQGCRLEIEGDRAETDPKVYTKITVRYVVYGDGLDPAKVDRAIKLSAEKYCSASIMMGKTAEIEHVFEIRPAAAARDAEV
ncbi:OsmC family protein [Tistrella mobilis]|nr:OsmC family protein [Tistrella sp.]